MFIDQLKVTTTYYNIVIYDYSISFIIIIEWNLQNSLNVT